MLGLIGEGTGIAAKVLKSMGINLKEARIEVEKIIGRGSGKGFLLHAPPPARRCHNNSLLLTTRYLHPDGLAVPLYEQAAKQAT